jgi:hypothetical protein
VAATILTILVGLIAALPEILKLIEGQMAANKGAKQSDARTGAENIDILLPPLPPSQ